MPDLIKNGKLVKKFTYDKVGQKACRDEALRTGGKCVIRNEQNTEDTDEGGGY